MTVVNTAIPTLSGTFQQGRTVQTSNGSWTFDLDYLTYAYQWERCNAMGASCVDIGGATSSSYICQLADVGSTLRSRVTATEHSNTGTGTLFDQFTDFGGSYVTSLTPPGQTDTMQNRYRHYSVDGNPDYYFMAPGYVGTNWSSVGAPAIQEISTPYGGGFKFIVTPEMVQPAGGKLAFISDSNATPDHVFNGGLGSTEDWSGKFYFPSSGNSSGFPTSNPAGVLWEFHTASASGHHMALEPNTSGPRRLRFGVQTGVGASYTFYYTSGTVSMDTWHSWRMQIKWASDGTGFVNAYFDSTQIANYTGPTIFSGQTPWLQFGYYADTTPGINNEIWHADVRKQ